MSRALEKVKPAQGNAHLPARPVCRGGAFILLAVLIVVMLASMVVISLLFRMQAEETATAAGAGSGQAWAAAMSGVAEAMRVAAHITPGSLEWQEDTASFRERLVVDDGAERWFFSVFSPADSREEVRFGLIDEASKLNLNQATEEMLEKLPRLTPALVQGLLDFLDSDDAPRPEGAEQEYYDALPRPYGVLNGPLRTVDELLLVRGFTPALLYGEDANWNFQLDASEDDGELQFPPDNKDGRLDPGLRLNITACSYDLNLDNSGFPRTELNSSSNLTPPQGSGGEELPPPVIAYVEALRRNKVLLSDPSDLLEAAGRFKDQAGRDVDLESGVGKSELPLVLDRFTTRSGDPRMPGLINVNTASSAVLQTLPGIDEALADSIVSARRNLRSEQRSTPAWLYQEGLLDAGQFKKISRYVTGRAFQYQFHVVGYGVPSGRYRVLQVVIDTAGSKPVILYLRDITRLGLPFRIITQPDIFDPGLSGENSAAGFFWEEPQGSSRSVFPGRAFALSFHV